MYRFLYPWERFGSFLVLHYIIRASGVTSAPPCRDPVPIDTRSDIPALLRSVNKHRMRNVKISGALKCMTGAAQHGFAEMGTNQLHAQWKSRRGKTAG
jgi:hypothetical protein